MSTTHTKSAPTKPTAKLSGNAHQRRKLRRAPKREQFRERNREQQ